MKLDNEATWNRVAQQAAARDRFNEREAAQDSAYARLGTYLAMVASRKANLLEYTPRSVGVETVARQNVLIVDNVATARFSALLAEALLQMSEDIHEDGDRASMSGALSHADAVVLVREYDGVRPAARATGISKDALWRALKKEAA